MSDNVILIAKEYPRCGSCPLRVCGNCEDWCVPAQRVLKADDYEHHPEFCPIRKAPDFKDVPYCRYDDYNDDAVAAYGEAVGWNSCLSELVL